MEDSIMKKIYMIPAVNIVAIHSTAMIAQSMNKYNTGGRDVLSKEENSSWSDIWEE